MSRLSALPRGPRRFLAPGLLAVAVLALGLSPVLAGANISKLKKDLKEALIANDEGKIGAAVQAIAKVGGKKGMSTILKFVGKYGRKLDGKRYWQLVNGASAFRDAEAMEELGEFIAKKHKTALATDLLFALQNNASSNVLKALGEVLEKGSYDQKLLVVDQLAGIQSVPSGDLLVKILEEAESDQLKQRAVNALSALTGKDMGDAGNWIGWWKANRTKQPFEKAAEGEGGDISSVTRDGARGGEVGSLERLKGGKVLVITGGGCCDRFDHNYDHLDAVVRELGMECETMNKREFAKINPEKLKGIAAILVNCTQSQPHCICPTCKPTGATNMRMQTCGGCDKHDIVRDTMPQKGIDLIKAFVETGGYLFTEDWGLVDVLDRTWPDIVKVGAYFREKDKLPPGANNGGGGGQGGEERKQVEVPNGGMVAVTPAPGVATHPYMRGVFLKPKSERAKEPIPEGTGTVERGGGRVGSEFMAPSHKWKIDDDSPSIHIVDKRRVKVLLVSDELHKATKGDSSVAITFHVGKEAHTTDGGRVPTGGSRGKEAVSSAERLPGGRVMHVLSHFGKQQSVADELALRNLLVNFLLECARRRVGG